MEMRAAGRARMATGGGVALPEPANECEDDELDSTVSTCLRSLQLR